MSSVKDTSGNNKKNRRAYLNDFQKDATGAYVYTGAVYEYEGSAQSLRSFKVRLSVLSALALIMLLWAGFIRVPGMDHSIYVLLPYAAALCGSSSVCWALIRLLSGGLSLRAYLYEESIEKLPIRSLFTACCCVFALAGELAYLFTNGISILHSGCIPFFIQQICCIASMFLLRSDVMRTKWHRRNETATNREEN